MHAPGETFSIAPPPPHPVGPPGRMKSEIAVFNHPGILGLISIAPLL